jgi:hypothetical protein
MNTSIWMRLIIPYWKFRRNPPPVEPVRKVISGPLRVGCPKLVYNFISKKLYLCSIIFNISFMMKPVRELGLAFELAQCKAKLKEEQSKVERLESKLATSKKKYAKLKKEHDSELKKIVSPNEYINELLSDINTLIS